MTKRLRKRLTAFALSAVFALSCVPTVPYAAESEDLQEFSPAEISADFGPHTANGVRAHAYDPFERMNEQETLEKLPHSENVVVFKRKEGGASLFSSEADKTDELLSSLGAQTEVVRTNEIEGARLFSADTEVTYRATIENSGVWDAVKRLEKMDDIVYAEPEYLFTSSAVGIPDESTDSGMLEQWYIAANDPGIKTAWEYLKDNGFKYGGNGDTVVAVIDTGVDYNHEDLTNNMWVNLAELNGTPGVDDDGNGYIDDIHGVSTVGASFEHNGNPMDDHGHGTHVAGIIGMTAFNGTGGAGVAPGSRIMAIKAGQASGVFSSTDIAEALDYAAAMGADIINMSFGSYARSAIVEDALKNAFGSCVLVAAAGNDNVPTTSSIPTPESLKPANMYPAAYPYVLGVMAYNQFFQKAGFSNWDYFPNDAQEYEVIAPGVDIYSTLPDNRYAKWSGTSMAAPMVAGAAALLRSKYSDKSVYSSRFIMGQLSAASTWSMPYIDLFGNLHSFTKLSIRESIENTPVPNVTYKEHYIFDTADIAESNDADGIIDAGETVDLAVVLRNQWGKADDVTLTVDAKSPTGIDNPYVTFETDTVSYGAIGTFNEDDNGLVRSDEGKITGVENPIRFTVSKDAPNDTVITLNLHITAKNGYDADDSNEYTTDKQISVMVQKGRVLKGVIEEDMTLTKDDYWIIENSTLIPEGVTVNVEPGTQIQFWSSEPEGPYSDKAMAYIKVEGELNINGTYDEPVEMFPSLAFADYGCEVFSSAQIQSTGYNQPIGKISMEHVDIINPRLNFEYGNYINAVQDSKTVFFRYIAGTDIIDGDASYGDAISKFNCADAKNSHLKNIKSSISRSCFKNVIFDNCVIDFFYDCKITDCVFLGNTSGLINNNSVASTVDTGKGIGVYCGVDKKLFDYNKWSFNKVGSYNGKKYLVLSCNEYIRTDIGTMKFIDSIAKLRGGCIAKPDDEDEIGFLFNNPVYAVIGLIFDFDGRTYWMDGESFKGFDDIDINAPIYDYTQYALIAGESIMSTNYSKSFVLEFPENVADEIITASWEDDFDKAILNMDLNIFNNAILNRTINPNTNQWMKIKSDEGNSYVYNFTNNYWGTTDMELINKQITDFDDYQTLSNIIQTPILTEPPETAYPFVTDIEVFDSEGNKLTEAGAQEITVKVHFNRDMDQNVMPMVSMGPAEPWTDFVISGDWESARTWSGTYNVTPMTGDGMMYFRVIGAAAADDKWLVTGDDWGRFAVEVITSGAEAMTLQASGGENKVTLQWTQDDYDTLAGYNLYRSREENSGYEKINSTIIPSEQKEYTDTDVKPGINYYYKFTVLTTDMKESGFSNIAHAAPYDNIKPQISHTPITSATLNAPIQIYADITDNIKVDLAALYYRSAGAERWKSLKMNTVSENRYTATIPSADVTGNIEYYIEASDGTSWAREGSEGLPYVIAVNNAPIIYSVSPKESTVTSGTRINLSGTNFAEGAKVYVGDKEADNVEVIDAMSITAIAPENPVGVYDIRVENPDGQSSVLTRAFTYKNGALTLQAQSASGSAGQTVRIPVSAENAGDITSAEFTLGYDSTSLTFIDAEKSLSAADMTLAYNDETGAIKVSLAGAEGVKGNAPLVYLNFRIKVDTSFATTPITLSAAKINDLDVTNLIDSVVTYIENYLISGSASYFGSGASIRNVAVRTAAAAAVTDESGKYTISGLVPGEYTVTPSKSDEQSALSAYDASLILQYSVGSLQLNANQLIAGDVNESGEVNAADAALVLQAAVGKISGAMPGSNKVWKFTPEFRNVNLTADTSGQSFVGVLLGDVSGNWGSALGQSVSDDEQINVTVPDGRKSFNIPIVYAPSKTGKSMDMTIKFSSNVTNASVQLSPSMKNFTAEQNFVGSELKIAVAGTEDIPFGNESLMNLTVTLNNEITADSPEIITVSSVSIDEAAQPNGQKITVSGGIAAELICGGVPTGVLPVVGNEMTVRLKPESVQPENAVMFAAFYSGSDRKLVSVFMVTDKTDDGVYEKMLTVPNDADSMKIMLIDTETMQPMKGYREFKY